MTLPQFTAELSFRSAVQPCCQLREHEKASRGDVVPAYWVQSGTTIWYCDDSGCTAVASAGGGISGWTYL
jgi:hypothetical protein